MKCVNCGHELPDTAKFCVNCGAKIEATEPVVEEAVVEETVVEAPVVEAAVVEETVVEEPVVVTPVIEQAGVKEWYYVENNASKGPCTEAEILAMVAAGTLNASSFIWKEGMQSWTALGETPLAGKQTNNPPKVEEPKAEKVKEEPKGWFYITAQNQQQGPVEESVMKNLIETNAINGNTYVWKDGMKDWDFLKNTVLARYLNSTSNTNTYSYNNANTGSFGIPIQKRSIAMGVVLTIVTCGIYGWYWLYCLVEDTNKVLQSQNRAPLTSGGMVILLSIVTCGIYLIYILYKIGKSIGELRFANGYQASDDSIIALVLAIFGLGLVSYCILQNNLNDITEYASL